MRNILIIINAIFIQFFVNAQDVKNLEKSIPYKEAKDISIHIDQAELIKVNVWDKKEISIKAQVDLSDSKGKNKNDDFHIEHHINWKSVKIYSKVDGNNYTTLVSKSGSDVKKGDKKTLVAGSVVEIWVPENTNLEIETSLAKVEVEHSGKSLLVSNNNNIKMYCKEDIDANFNVSTFMGDIKYELPEIELETKDGLKTLKNNNVSFTTKDGKYEISLRTMVGNIRILTKSQ